MMVEIVIRSAGRAFADVVAGCARLTALGLVVGEHVDKIGLFEPAVEVVEKEVLVDRLRFVLRMSGETAKPIAEIVRGFRIGCFKIAREYGLLSSDDRMPIFEQDFEMREIGLE